MNDVLIDNINSLVAPNDILWHLGDVIMANVKEFAPLRERIKCKNIHLIWGNHDSDLQKERWWTPHFSSAQWYKRLKWEGRKIYMFHNPIDSWTDVHKGSIHLFGHCHGNMPDRGDRRMDVGVDCNDYKPFLLSDVVDMMEARPIKTPGDHHGSSNESCQIT